MKDDQAAKTTGRYTDGLRVGKLRQKQSYRVILTITGTAEIGARGARMCLPAESVGHAEQCSLRVCRFGGRDGLHGEVAG